MKIIPIEEVLKPLINNPEIADVKFCVGKEGIEMYGHKTLLAVSSEMWKTMFFSGNWIEVQNKNRAKVDIPDVDPFAFKAVLEFSYTKKVTLNDDIVIEVLYAADKFLMPELKELCGEYLSKNLSSRNCLLLFDKALKFNEIELKNRAAEFFEENSLQVFGEQPNCFVGLRRKTVSQILSNRQLVAREIDLFRALVNWGKDRVKKQLKVNKTKLTKKVGELKQQQQQEQEEQDNKNKNKNKSKIKSKLSNDESSTYSSTLSTSSSTSTLISTTSNSEQEQDLQEHNKEKEKEKEQNKEKEKEKVKLKTESFDKKIILHNNHSKRRRRRKKKKKLIIFLKKELHHLLGKIDISLMNFDDLHEILGTKLIPSRIIAKQSIELGKIHQKKIRVPTTRGKKRKSGIRVLMVITRKNLDQENNMKSSITSAGISLDNVTVIDASKRTPSSREMKRYDSIFLRSGCSPFKDATKLGDHLFDFVKQGGGLVICAFRTLDLTSNGAYDIKGKIIDEGLIPLKKANFANDVKRGLGEVVQPQHPIMNGISTFDCESTTRHIPTNNTQGGKVIAKWNNDYPLITIKKKKPYFGTVVVLNINPISSRSCSGSCSFNSESDGSLLIANSIEFVAND
ncbi:btb (poz) domain-containing 2a-related [Anaeramoeba flamelloides]|uniref:Btb (Poz) domain-containing 2a-related n=1 Tax=Anaeramoeba flamelloides TaxID=1746091 RepID=A0AAV7YIB4_9EUKA|nr:btb (poz) domain-containing 2a-related [Anaeramoeba flamelloides]